MHSFSKCRDGDNFLYLKGILVSGDMMKGILVSGDMNCIIYLIMDALLPKYIEPMAIFICAE